MFSLFAILWLSAVVRANTEAYGFQIPNYYDIPEHNADSLYNSEISALNSSALLLRDHPILTIDSYSTEQSVLTVPYNYSSKPKQQLFVKLNNYNNSAFSSNDLVNVKLCWPATTPVNFRISHRFIREREFVGIETGSNTLDMYIVVEYAADFYALDLVESTSFDIILAVSRLPNRVPIPIELYDYIVYAVDLMILTATAVPWVSRAIQQTVS